METEKIILLERRTRLHASSATQEGWVSSTSRWSDDEWSLDPPKGRFMPSDCRMHWGGDVPAGIRSQLKELAWSLLVSRPRRKPVALSRAQGLARQLNHLGRWMAWRRVPSFADITPILVSAYVDDLKEHLATEKDGSPRTIELDPNTVSLYLMPLQYAHEQRRALEKRRLSGIRDDPFAGSSPWTIAESMAVEDEGAAPPLPDEVVMRIVTAAQRLVGEPAEDILALAAICLDEREDTRSAAAMMRHTRKRLEAFEFRTISGEADPWHPPMGEYLAREREKDPGEKVVDNAKDRVRRLMSDLMAACVTLVRFQSGIRHAEIFTFAPGLDEDGMPRCVATELSSSGAYELFFVEGVVSKGWDHPEEARWLLAGRVAGGNDEPVAIRALKVLARLTQPWRDWNGTEKIAGEFLLQIGWKGLPREPNLVKPLGSEKLGLLMQEFIVRNAGLECLDPADPALDDYRVSRGACIQSRQWRKTWANWVIRVDRRLLPAISQQFKHVSTALTEEAYVGRDPTQLGLIESAAMKRAVLFVRNSLEGRAGTGGAMRKRIAEGMVDVDARLRGLTDAQRDAGIRRFLVERDFRLWFSPHGKCFIGLLPGDSRCHEVAGTLDWSNQTPNFATRDPRLCSGCQCFGVDEEDLPFWQERYLENRRIWDAAERDGRELHYKVAKERWVQSENVLKSLGVEVASLAPLLGPEVVSDAP